MKSKICCFLFRGRMRDRVYTLTNTHTHTLTPHSALVVNKQTAALAELYLIYRTFVALDIYRGSGAVNFMQTSSKRSMPRAPGPRVSASSQVFSRWDKSLQLDPEHREGDGWRWGWWGVDARRERVGWTDRGRRAVGRGGCWHPWETRRTAPAPFLPR